MANSNPDPGTLDEARAQLAALTQAANDAAAQVTSLNTALDNFKAKSQELIVALMARLTAPLATALTSVGTALAALLHLTGAKPEGKPDEDAIRKKNAEKRGVDDSYRNAETSNTEREEAASNRTIDQAEARGKITGQVANNLRVGVLEHRRDRVSEERKRLLAEAAKLENPDPEKGEVKDEGAAAKDRQAAAEKSKEIDTLNNQIQDLRDPLPTRVTAAADDLQKRGGGGGVFYGLETSGAAGAAAMAGATAAVATGGGKDPLVAKFDRQIKVSEEVAASLRSIVERSGGSAFA